MTNVCYDIGSSLIASYKSIRGPPIQVIDANDEIELVQNNVVDLMTTRFPILARQETSLCKNILEYESRVMFFLNFNHANFIS